MSVDTRQTGSTDRNRRTIYGLDGEVSEDGRRYRLGWFRGRTRYAALFRVATDDRVSVLQHLRMIRVSQRVSERLTELKPDVTLDDLPDAALELMRSEGFEPADGVEQ